jgi:hypothetical protein
MTCRQIRYACLAGLDLGRFSINFVLRFEPTGCGLNETRKGTQSHTADDAVELGGERKETRWQKTNKFLNKSQGIRQKLNNYIKITWVIQKKCVLLQRFKQKKRF